MRPKKRILLIDANEKRASELRFPIETTGKYIVLHAGTAEEARLIAGDRPTDLVVAPFPSPVDLRRLFNLPDLVHTPSLLIIARPTVAAEEFPASASVTKPSMAELLDRIAMISARKRGPRKGTPKPVRSVSAADILAAERNQDRRLA